MFLIVFFIFFIRILFLKLGLLNFNPIIAISFLSLIIEKRFVFYSILSFIISDFFLYSSSISLLSFSPYLYISILLSLFLTNFLKKNILILPILGSFFFFLFTNFFVWLNFFQPFERMYDFSFNGLIECYVYALPFLFKSLMGDLCFFYSFILLNKCFYFGVLKK